MHYSSIRNKSNIYKFVGGVIMNKYRICTRCIMDTTHREIEFDEDGICNH